VGSPSPLGRPCAPSPPGVWLHRSPYLEFLTPISAAAPHCYSASTRRHDRTSGCSASLRPSPDALLCFPLLLMRCSALPSAPLLPLPLWSVLSDRQPPPSPLQDLLLEGRLEEAARVLLLLDVHQRRRWGNSSPSAAAPRVGGEEGRERRSGSCPAQWRTRRGDGETAARRRLLLARMGNRGGGGGASAAAASTGGAGERVRAGEQVGPSSLRALLSLLSDFSCAPLSPRA